MSLPITVPKDFVGEISISSNQYDEKDLILYIQRYEKEILEDLLGCDMATELIADLDVSNTPTDPKFLDIWNAFCKDDDGSLIYDYGYFYHYHPNYTGYGCKVQWKSRGIRELLKYIIYFRYVRDQKVKNTITGNVVNQNNTSREARNPESNISRLYNNSLDWYWSIQWNICRNENSYDYDNYNGIRKEVISIL